MLNTKKKKFSLKVSPVALGVSSLFIIIVVAIVWRFASIHQSNVASYEVEETATSNAGAAATKIKDTGYDGTTSNTKDPVAIRVYCDDVVDAAKRGEGAKIRDLCILDEVVEKYLPTLSDIELADLAENHPSCLETGYYEDGFNCFTDMDRNGCGRSGIDADGNECRTVNAVKDVPAVFTGVPDNICDIVSGCQSEAAFGPDGFNEYGCNRQGKLANGEMCPAEYITRIYGSDDRDQLGFDRQGFNEFNCDAQGLNREGEMCSLENITRVYDRNSVDQFGFGEDGFNSKNCNIEGLNRAGEVCSLSDITKLYDSKTNLDQFGFGRDGFNSKNCNIHGFNRLGELCSLEDITRIIGKNGLDQFGLRANGRNIYNCDIKGLKPNGTACALDEITKMISPMTGKDQFGFYANGRNDFDCDYKGLKPNGEVCSINEMSRVLSKVTGRDANNLDEAGFNENSCDLQGFNRKGERCDLSDVTRIFDENTGFDQFGIGKDGFNENSCNIEGFNRLGERCSLEDSPRIFDKMGVDQFGFKKDGYNLNNCDINGLNRSGELCATSDITRVIDPLTGLDQFNLDKDGFSIETNCNLQGFNRSGARCDYEDIPKILDKNNINQLGYSLDNFNSNGCDINGRKRDGTLCSVSEQTQSYDEDNMSVFHKDPNGVSRLNFNELGFNDKNCDIDGKKPDGSLCAIEDITHVYSADTNLDQFGLSRDGYNEFDCDLFGKTRSGEECLPENITRIFGDDMKDQFGNHINSLPDSVWVNEKLKTEGLTPLLDDNGNQVFVNGKPAFLDKNGVVRDENGVALRDRDNKMLTLGHDGKVRNSDGRVANVYDENGNQVLGKLKSENNKLSPLLDSDGNQVMINGKPAFVDSNNIVRAPDGSIMLDEEGNPLSLGVDGKVRDSSGNEVVARKAGGSLVEGPLSAGSLGLTPLLDENGNQVFVNGEAAYVDSNGTVKNKAGGAILENGEIVTLDELGNLTTSSGKKVDSQLSNGEDVDGALYAKGHGLSPLLDSNGNQVMVNGKPAFVDSKGIIRDKTGALIRDENGGVISLESNGVLKDSTGNVVSARTIGDSEVSGKLNSALSDLSPILDSDGNQVFIDGKPVYADKNGIVKNADGKVVNGKDGKPLTLTSNGKIKDSLGFDVAAYEYFGNEIKSPMSSANKGLTPLVDENGEQVYINGKPAFVDPNGIVKDSSGKALKGADGKALTLDSEGNVVSSNGTRVLATDKNGKVTNSKLARKTEKSQPLKDANGKQVFVNGKLASVDGNGNLRNPDGTLMRDEFGGVITLDSEGNLVDSKGGFIQATDSAGRKIDGPLSSLGNGLEPLLDSDGNQVMLNGKPAFVGEDGVIRSSDGKSIKDAYGKDYSLGLDGTVYDSNGKAATVTDSFGNKVEGSLNAKNGEMTPLLDKNGNQVLINGKRAFIGKDGIVKDKFGKVITDSEGNPLKLNSLGEVVDGKGLVVSATDVDGNVIDGPLNSEGKGVAPLLDRSGKQMMVNGEPAFIDENGVVRNADAEILVDGLGNPLVMDDMGNIIDSLGNKVKVTDLTGKVIEGPFNAANAEKSPLLDSDGNQVYIDGKPAYVDENGNIRDLNGNLMRDSRGGLLTLDSDGVVRDSKNNNVDVTNSDGEMLTGPLHSEFAGLSPLMDENGEQVLINGVPAYTDENGAVKNADGETILDSFGKELTLGADGNVRDSQGKVVKATLLDGSEVSSGLFGLNEKTSSLLSSDGEPVYVDGKPAFVDSNGVLRDANGLVKKDQYGGLITLGADGKLRDSKGEIVDTFNSDGRKTDSPLYSDALGVTPVLDKDGNPVFINGKQAFVDENGVVVDENGDKILDSANGEMKLGTDGRIKDSMGQIVSAKSSDGKLVTGPLSAANKLLTPLLDENGNPVMIDGKRAFVDKNGIIRDANNKLMLDSAGGTMALGSDGKVRDSRGGVVAVSDMTGTAVSGPLHSDLTDSNSEKLTPMVGENGELIYINGEPAFLDKQGNLVDKNNNPIRDENGNALSLNEYGQVVNSIGEVQPKSLFRKSNGDIADGSFSAGKSITETQLNAKMAAEKIPESVRRALNLDEDGYNENNCSLEGLNRNGELCSIVDSPRIFDEETGLDQFGYQKDNFNIYGCLESGVDRNGNACREDYVTKRYDAFGYDQDSKNRAGFNSAGINEKGENTFGCDAAGNNCSEKMTPKITDGVGADQFGSKVNGADRLGLVNGFNDKGCSIAGLDAKGNRCAIEDIPVFYNSDNVDQFGVGLNGVNKFGCGFDGRRKDGSVCSLNEIPRIFDKDNLDQFDLTPAGRTIDGCDLNGFKADGTRCSVSETPRITSVDGVDQMGFGDDGLNANGCDINGVRVDGTRCDIKDVTRVINPVTGLDQFLLDADGFNAKGCNLKGINRQGELCSPEDIPRIYDENAVDQLGFKEDGYNVNDCDIYGYSRDGELCSSSNVTRIFGDDEKDQFGVDKNTNVNSKGCNIDGFLPNGKRCKPQNVIRFVKKDGTDQFGMTNNFNRMGCDINGLNEAGERCDIDDVTRIVNPETKLDQLGLDSENRNIHGCGIDGLMENGEPCKVEHLTHWYDKSGMDQFKVLESGFNNSGCSLLGMREDGTLCDSQNIPSIFGKSGYSQLGLNIKGYTVNGEDLEGYDPRGCNELNQKRDGTPCAKYENLNLSAEDKMFMDENEKIASKWMSKVREKLSKRDDIQKGSYSDEGTSQIVEQPKVDSSYVGENRASTSLGRSDRVLGEQSPGQVNRYAQTGNRIEPAGENNDASTLESKVINIPAGYMTSVNVKTPVNSDYTQDVYATISLGELEGATLIGRPVIPYIDDAVMPRDKFYYEFTKIVYKRQTIGIDAVTITLGNDSGMVEADDVDYHTFQRYGGLIVASAIQALDASFLDSQAEADAEAQAETLGELTSSAVVYGENTRALTKENLKTATEYASDLAKEQFTRRPTIHEGIGPQMIIFRTQVQDERLPVVVVGLE